MKSAHFNQNIASLQRDVNEEEGLATYLTGLALAFGLLALMLIFTPFMNLYGSRRISQNGADAAAHAAAGYYADRFSVRWPPIPYQKPGLAMCYSVPYPTLDQVRDETRREAVDLYKYYYEGSTLAFMGAARGEAQRYAQDNETDLAPGEFFSSVTQRFSQFRYEHQDTGRTLKPLLVRLGTNFSYSARTGHTSDVPAFAAALPYIKKVEAPIDTPVPSLTVFDPLTGLPCTAWLVQYKYSWQLTMVSYD